MDIEDIQTSGNFTEHVFDGSSHSIMNSIQYTSLSIVPLLLIHNVLETQLPQFSQNTPPISMIMEIFIHIVIILVVLYFVDKIIRYFPSFSGTRYGDVSFETIGLILVLLIVNSTNSNLGKKVIHISRHVRERFENKEGMTTTKRTHKMPSSLPKMLTKQQPQPPPPPPPPPQQLGHSPEEEEEVGEKNIAAPSENQEGFSATSSLEAFAIGGGNYSLF